MTNVHRSLQVFLWSYVVVYCVFSSLQITQVDIWWQLAEGQHILRTGTLPTEPVAAFGLPAHPYFDEYAGYEIVLALIYQIGGFPVIWAVFAAIYLSVLLLPFATTEQKYPRIDFFSSATLFFAGLLLKQRLEQRPEFVAALFLVVLMVILRKSRLASVTPRTMAALVLLFIAWSNTHSTFVIGFFTLGLWLGCELIGSARGDAVGPLVRRALIMVVLVVLASMLNPYGPRRLLFPFMQAFDPGSVTLSVEMWPIPDFTSPAAILLEICVGCLAWALVTARPAAWLILFSIVSVYLSVKSYRFIGLVAICLLFAASERREREKAKGAKHVAVTASQCLALGVACVFIGLGDAFNLLANYADLSGENRVGTRTVRFSSAICALRVDNSGLRVPLLCGHGVGSYVSFTANSRFRPLLDSGLSHFSDDTKRYFFFVWHEPEALGLALLQIHVKYVLVNRDTYQWIPTMNRLPDWQFVTCDSAAVLWRRAIDGRHPLTAEQRDLISSCVTELRNRNEIVGAFAYSTMLNEPARSLDILEHYGGMDWSDAVFISVCTWVDSLPTATVQSFLAGDHPHTYPLVDAILAYRLGPDVFDRWLAAAPSGPRPWFWKALEVKNALRKNDLAQARILFDSISPTPISSVTYYRLWHEVRPGEASALSAYGQWQTWDASGPAFIASMSARLNDRLVDLAQRPDP